MTAPVFSPCAIAIVNTSNFPLLVRTNVDEIDKEEATKLIFLLHASLDIVEEKAEQSTTRDNFLGILYQSEQHKIYGLMSTTKVKVLMMISQRHSFGTPRENVIRLMLKDIHRAFVNATAMNPFYKPNEPVKSKRLDSYLDTLFVSTEPNGATAANATPPIDGAPISGQISPLPGSTGQAIQTV